MKTSTRTLLAGLLVGFSAASQAALDHADTSFMKSAAEAGATEIEASQLAGQKASSAEVKTFAATMVTDHTKVAEELKTLAQQKGVKLPDGPSMIQKAKLKTLSMHKGAAYDKDYAEEIGVKAHEDTIKLFQTASTSAKDADVKAWAAKTLPGLQHHLEMAKTLQAGTAAAAAK